MKVDHSELDSKVVMIWGSIPNGHVGIVAAALFAWVTIRLVAVLFPTRLVWPRNVPRTKNMLSKKTLVVLGSGGHTAEMMQLTKKLRTERFNPIHYVLAETDTTSLGKVEVLLGSALPLSRVHRIPRSREVGQSWLSSVLSTFHACIWSVVLVVRLRPKLVIANGPGTCLPVCVATFFFRVLGVLDARVVFCESFCRVKTLSLTGLLLYPMVDRFVVQWPELAKRYVDNSGPLLVTSLLLI
jgi:beta-1,4-N-acetylglucosaminyltransferase